MLKVVFFGDSICVGQLVAPHRTWVHRVSASLCERYPLSDVVVSNVSVSGNTTRMALERMKYQVGATGVDVFYTQFGLNDANHWADEGGLPRTMPETFHANLVEILERARAWGARTLAIGTNHPVPDRDPGRWPAGISPYPKWVERYNAIIRDVSRQTGALLIDHERDWIAGRIDLGDHLLSDGVHLSEKGHDRYFAFANATYADLVAPFTVDRGA